VGRTERKLNLLLLRQYKRNIHLTSNFWTSA